MFLYSLWVGNVIIELGFHQGVSVMFLIFLNCKQTESYSPRSGAGLSSFPARDEHDPSLAEEKKREENVCSVCRYDN